MSICDTLIKQDSWTLEQATVLYNLPFNNLVAYANRVFSQHFDVNKVQASVLLNIKKGGCPENCSYCSQSVSFKSGRENVKPLLAVEEVVEAAKIAKSKGATRFCMAAAWRGPTKNNIATLSEMVKEVKALGLETCLSAGLLSKEQACDLKAAGLEFYNHNIDCSEEYYSKIISSRTFVDRMQTISNVMEAGIEVCCGGIIGLGEEVADRIKMLLTLANLKPYPKSIPLNMLVRIPGTALAENVAVESIDFIRTVALARILMPKAYVRLAAGRSNMSAEMQAWCFFVGVNSVFYGDELLTTPNPMPDQDLNLFAKLGIELEEAKV